ncbi:MAG: ABC transporter ATP-binding protein [Acidimicrobiales bacterium]
MIACELLSVRVDGTTLVDSVSLRVGAGEWVSVLGPNGAGKSTLLRALAGLMPVSGTVELDSRPLLSLSRRDRARRLALVPQDPIIPPAITVVDYVLLGRTPHLAFFGTERSVDLDVVAGVLAQLELEDLGRRSVATLSGGERQRVLLARALAQRPTVLLLDEPSTALDVGHQQEVLELVDSLRRSEGLTVVTTMHDLTLAGQYADRLVLLDHGRVIAEGEAADVLTEERLTALYGAQVRVIATGDGLVVVPTRRDRGDRAAAVAGGALLPPPSISA